MTHLRHWILIFLYRGFVVPLGLLFLLFAALFNTKIRALLEERRLRPDWPDWLGKRRTLWVHAASGEFEYARAVIRAWRAEFPDWAIIATYYSPSFAKTVRTERNIDFALPLPLDLIGPVRSLLRRIKPDLLMVARTDVWPELCLQARASKVPVVLFSVTAQRRARWSVRTLVQRWRLELLHQIHTVSETDRQNLLTMGVSCPIHVSGDTRYDQVEFRLKHPKLVHGHLRPSHGPAILAAGSSWPEDESVLMDAASDLVRQGQLRLLIVPHEPTAQHVESLIGACTAQGLNVTRYTFPRGADWQVMIVDQVGILAELYTWADMALVGGSFRTCVHSVMEPLAVGLPVAVGPYHQNNREAVEFQAVKLSGGRSAVTVATNAAELKIWIEQNLNPDPKIKEIIRAEVGRRTGASRRLIAQLRKDLKL